jgi:hypothetical protein
MALKKAGLAAIIVAAAAIVSIVVAVQALQPMVDDGSEEARDQRSASSASAQEPGSVLKLSAASVPIDMPMIKAYENGNDIYLITTDVSDSDLASQLTDITGFKVNVAPLLAQTPEEARGQVYVFRNGVEGDGTSGFQAAVVNAKPGDEEYSPLMQLNYVDWSSGSSPAELRSVEEIMEAESSGQLTVTETDAIVNHPAVMWDGGALTVREDKDSINDDSPYMGGQVLEIDTDDMVATFVAHRGWGPDGKTIYYIVTDATPEMPANMMGVPLVQLDERLARTPVAVDLFQFTSGIAGSGPMGFQAGIGGANPTDENYSPMWRISFIEWKDPASARLLETIADINVVGEEGMITVTPAMEGRHVVNCPFFDQNTVFEHRSDRF